MAKDDEKTPAINRRISPTPWEMHPELPRVKTPPPLIADTGHNQRLLEAVLAKVETMIATSEAVKVSSSQACQKAIDAFEKLPRLEKRMNRVEYVACGALIINIILLFVAK